MLGVADLWPIAGAIAIFLLFLQLCTQNCGTCKMIHLSRKHEGIALDLFDLKFGLRPEETLDYQCVTFLLCQ